MIDNMKLKLRAGTRGSKLARRQTALIIEKIIANNPDLEIDEVVISTKGDQDKRPFKNLVTGGEMGLFTKELEKALLSGEIDFAVHSLKDLPVELPPGLVLGAIPKRELPFDALVTRDRKTLSDLPPGSLIGTSSQRRAYQIKYHYPDLKVVDMRGNLDTRLGKLARGEVDAVILAAAGLARLGYRETEDFSLIPPEICLPAPGQGALAVEVRQGDSYLQDICRHTLDDHPTRQAVSAERCLLQALGGGCQVPLGAFSQVKGDTLLLQGVVAAPDGTLILKAEARCHVENPQEASSLLAAELIEKGAKEILTCE